jgi:hypothetical protein
LPCIQIRLRRLGKVEGEFPGVAVDVETEGRFERVKFPLQEILLSLHRIQGEERFHLVLDEHGRVMDVCRTGQRKKGWSLCVKTNARKRNVA